MSESQQNQKSKVVIKIGSGVLAHEEGARLNFAMIARLTEGIARINAAGHQVIVVSSGAVAAGLSSFDLKSRPEDTGMLQACAAAGQARLMQVYENQFSNYDLKIAQILLTLEDFGDNRRRENVVAMMSHLLRFPKVIPIVNENDSVAVFELKFGDNDHLSSEVAQLIGADQLILLTSVNGLLAPDSTGPNDIVPVVDDVESVMNFASDNSGKLSVGGMKTKLEAIKKTVNAEIETLIASGHNPEQLLDLVEGRGIATRFAPSKK
ncbi:glutamate 5-kinase [Verrucomicrobiales bacterium]|nr:glutamate 5-kinase [Verrucomicrobiales bacterium]